MSRAYSAGKRNREIAQARKKQERDRRRSERRRKGPAEVPVVETADVTGDLDAAEAAVKRRKAAASQGRPAGIPARLFVGGLAWETTADDLRAAFEPFGPVADAIIVMDRGTGRSRGFGFVVMSHKDTAKAIAALNGSELQGRPIVVNVASERPR